MRVGRKQRWFDFRCLECGRKRSGVTVVGDDDVPPSAGDFTVCIDCGAVSVFKPDGTIRRPDVLEAMEAATDARVLAMRRSVFELNRRDPNRWRRQ